MTTTVPSPEGQRIAPEMAAHLYTTYQIVAPVSTHFRPGTCEEADCDAYRHGWRTIVDETTELGQQQAHYIRKESRRRFREERDATGLLTMFTFEAGQPCFTAANGTYDPRKPQHQVPLERPELFFRRPGDWRGNPTGERPFQHRKPEHWVEDFAEHQDRLAHRFNQG